MMKVIFLITIMTVLSFSEIDLSNSGNYEIMIIIVVIMIIIVAIETERLEHDSISCYL